MNAEIAIRAAEEKDFDEIWRIFFAIIKKGDTYVNDDETTKDAAYAKWFAKDSKTFVAQFQNKIIGAYLIRPNQVGRGSHVTNASYIVDENARGIGAGKTLALDSIQKAKDLGYKAMQFNFVVSTNKPAVSLWQSVGFKIIGTIPGAFKHKELGYVDAYIMHQDL